MTGSITLERFVFTLHSSLSTVRFVPSASWPREMDPKIVTPLSKCSQLSLGQANVGSMRTPSHSAGNMASMVRPHYHSHHPPDSSHSKSTWNRFLACLHSPPLLCLLLATYALFGACLFQRLESGRPVNTLPVDLDALRNHTIQRLWNITFTFNMLYPKNWTANATAELIQFERALAFLVHHHAYRPQSAFQVGQPAALSTVGSGPTTKSTPATIKDQWSFTGALLYSLTVITTLGKSHVFYTQITRCYLHILASFPRASTGASLVQLCQCYFDFNFPAGPSRTQCLTTVNQNSACSELFRSCALGTMFRRLFKSYIHIHFHYSPSFAAFNHFRTIAHHKHSMCSDSFVRRCLLICMCLAHSRRHSSFVILLIRILISFSIAHFARFLFHFCALCSV